MTDTDPKVPFYEKSFVGIGLSAVALFATIWICHAASAPPEVSQTVSAVALGVPTATYYALRGRSRNKTADAAALARGEIDRPAGLIIVIVAAALLLLDTILGIAAVFPGVLIAVLYAVGAVAIVVGSLFASLPLGLHPYRGILIAVVVALVARLVILTSLMSTVLEGLGAPEGFAPVLYVIVFITYVVFLGFAMLGVRLGASRRRTYITKKLARLAATHPAEVAAAVASAPVAAAPVGRAPGAAAPAAAPAAPAGWYADAELRGIERWWDGASWTDTRRNIPDSA